MKYKCLVFDHDDTVVNSTATIHQPCFQMYLDARYPGRTCSLEEYFLKNFDPGFVQMCRDDYGMSDADLLDETVFWSDYVREHIPAAYTGIAQLMERHKAQGGILCVSSHSLKENIYRDYKANGLPEPDMVFGWDLPAELRKPAPYALEQIMQHFDLCRDELLMIDDLKPGYDMARSCGVDFAAVGWSGDIPQIESFMRRSCKFYFKTVAELDDFLQ